MDTTIETTENDSTETSIAHEVVSTVAVTAAAVITSYVTVWAIGKVMIKVENRRAKKAAKNEI